MPDDMPDDMPYTGAAGDPFKVIYTRHTPRELRPIMFRVGGPFTPYAAGVATHNMPDWRPIYAVTIRRYDDDDM